VDAHTLNYIDVTSYTMGINLVERRYFYIFLIGTLTLLLFARYFPLLRLFRVI